MGSPLLPFALLKDGLSFVTLALLQAIEHGGLDGGGGLDAGGGMAPASCPATTYCCCFRDVQVGAVIVGANKVVLGIGYNGFPR